MAAKALGVKGRLQTKHASVSRSITASAHALHIHLIGLVRFTARLRAVRGAPQRMQVIGSGCC
jgi:hypothetical protein